MSVTNAANDGDDIVTYPSCEFCTLSEETLAMCEAMFVTGTLVGGNLFHQICTRPSGHEGDHVACGLFRCAITRWPREEEVRA